MTKKVNVILMISLVVVLIIVGRMLWSTKNNKQEMMLDSVIKRKTSVITDKKIEMLSREHQSFDNKIITQDNVLTTADKKTDKQLLNHIDNVSNTEQITKEHHVSNHPVIQSGQKYKLPVAPQLQQVWYYCAPTTVSMMLSSRGIEVDQFQLAKEMGTYEPYGTHNVDAIRVLNKYMFDVENPSTSSGGYHLETVIQVDEATLTLFKQRVMKNIKEGYPMYYTFDVSKIYPHLKGEHNVIGNGYVATPDGNDVAYVYYIDPSPNVQDDVYGSLKIVTPEELLNAMLTCGEPNYAW